MQQTLPTASPLGVIEPMRLLSLVLWVLIALWSIYTIVAAYHWLRYGHRSVVAIPALITHVVVSVGLLLFAVSGFAR